MSAGFASSQSLAALQRVVSAMRQQTTSMEAQQQTAAAAMAGARSHLAVGITTAVLLVGASQDVVVTWPNGGFPTAVYEVDIIPTGMPSSGSCMLIAQTSSAVTVRVTATALLALGTQFLVYGATNFP